MSALFSNSRFWFALAGLALLLGLGWYVFFQDTPLHTSVPLPPQTALLINCNGLDRAAEVAGRGTDTAWREVWQTPLFAVFQQDIALAAHLFAGNQSLLTSWMQGRTNAAFTLLPTDSLHALLVTDVGEKTDLPELLRKGNFPQGFRIANFHGFDLYTVQIDGGSRLAVAQTGNYVLISRSSSLVEEALATQLSGRQSFLVANQWDAFHPNDPLRMLLRMEATAPVLFKSLKPAWRSLPALLLRNIQWAGIAFDGTTTSAIAGAPKLGPAMESWGQHDLDQLFNILPDNTAVVGAVGFSNQIPFWEQVTDTPNQDFQQYIIPWASGTAAIAITNAFSNDIRDNQFLVLGVRDSVKAVASMETFGKLRGLLQIEDYQTFKVYQFLNNSILTPLLGESEAFRNPVCAMIGSQMVFASNRSAIELWIDQYIINATMANNPEVLLSRQLLGPGGNGLVMLNAADIPPLMNQFFGAPSDSARLAAPSHLSKLGLISLAIQAQGEILNIRVSTMYRKELPIPPALLWKTRLEANAVQPFAVCGPVGENRIMVQDVQGTFYCLGSNGDILWKRPISEPIIGGISTIDYYNNGNPTYLFNTARQIWLLDPAGNAVEGYPLNLQSPATNPVVAVDFEHNKKYSYFVACRNGNLYGFDQFGRPLHGWNPQGGTGLVRHAMLHFQFDQNDYCCVLNNAGKLQVFARSGERRFNPVQLEGVFISPPQVDFHTKKARILCFSAEGNLYSCDPATGSIDQSRVKSVPNIKHHQQAIHQSEPDSASFIAATLWDGQMLLSTRDGDQRSVAINRPVDTLFEAGPGGFGLFQRKQSRIFYVDKHGQTPFGFPLAGTTPFALCSGSGNDSSKIIVTGFESSLYAYKVR